MWKNVILSRLILFEKTLEVHVSNMRDGMSDKSILVVDGEQNVRTMMTQALEPLDIPVQTAINGEDALKKMEITPFSVVFLDLKMPGMDGLKVLRHIQQEHPGVRVVIVSAHGSVESVAEAMKLGAVDFLEKPFTPTEVRDLATQILEREVLETSQTIHFSDWTPLMQQPVSDRSIACARDIVCRAMSTGPSRAEAYSLLASLFEVGFQRLDEMGQLPKVKPTEPFIEGEL